MRAELAAMETIPYTAEAHVPYSSTKKAATVDAAPTTDSRKYPKPLSCDAHG